MDDKSYGTVVKEFDGFGRYKVRVLKTRSVRVLDVREYISTDSYTGFTKRGIRLVNVAAAIKLRAALDEIIKDEVLAGPEPTGCADE